MKEFLDSIEKNRMLGKINYSLRFSQLDEMLSNDQKLLVEKILKLNPKNFGVKTPYIGLEEVPNRLAIISDQQFKINGQVQKISDVYIPDQILKNFNTMNAAFQNDYPNRKLLIESAYRSPASQIITFVYWLYTAYNGDIAKTIRHASPPAYSQHTSASKTALDIKNIDGLPSDTQLDEFKNTVEYKWLKK
ncbi:MAG TPA: hypothetical protein VLG47_06585, partial [Candidatus Saccharimonadales bacterium]|nr:hypothetical protein [Candidatus Saccharimonadales bacterium]